MKPQTYSTTKYTRYGRRSLLLRYREWQRSKHNLKQIKLYGDLLEPGDLI